MLAKVTITEYEGVVGTTTLIQGTDESQFTRQCEAVFFDSVCQILGEDSGYTTEEIRKRIEEGVTSFTSTDDEYYVTIRDFDEHINVA